MGAAPHLFRGTMSFCPKMPQWALRGPRRLPRWWAFSRSDPALRPTIVVGCSIMLLHSIQLSVDMQERERPGTRILEKQWEIADRGSDVTERGREIRVTVDGWWGIDRLP